LSHPPAASTWDDHAAADSTVSGDTSTGGGSVAAVTLVTDDGFPLAATRHKAEGRRKGIMLVAPATGVHQRYYAAFAKHFAAEGWDVLTWDWRGVADSRHGVATTDPRLTMQAWGSEDLVAAIAWADRRAPHAPVVLVGHSFGGHAVGLARNASRLDALILVASQHGWLGHWNLAQQLVLMPWWWLVVPGLTRLLGRLPSRQLGLGENLPAGVALEWARWCRSRDFLGDWRGHAALTPPILAFSFADDLIAPRRAATALLREYRSASRVQHRHLKRHEVGCRRVGHFGFFRAGLVPGLWQECAAFLDATAAECLTPVPVRTALP
jgi:predicted alpha/beta hydrolase